MNAKMIMTSLVIATALFCSAVIAASTQRVELAQHGKSSCLLVDDRVFCAQTGLRAPIRLASFAFN